MELLESEATSSLALFPFVDKRESVSLRLPKGEPSLPDHLSLSESMPPKVAAGRQ